MSRWGKPELRGEPALHVLVFPFSQAGLNCEMYPGRELELKRLKETGVAPQRVPAFGTGCCGHI